MLIEYRWAEAQYDRLPTMVADLVHRQVTVIAATTTPAALAARAATTTIPIVFETGGDPVQLGLVASLNRPGSNVTGVTQLTAGLVAKELEVLHELLPTARIMALLVDPADPALAEAESREALSAARALGLELHILNASAETEFDGIFARLTELRANGLVICPEAFFTSHSERLAALAAHHAVPAIYKGREFTAAGGLASYGTSITDSYRLAGVYTGRVLKGELPADLPIQQATKVEPQQSQGARHQRPTAPVRPRRRGDRVSVTPGREQMSLSRRYAVSLFALGLTLPFNSALGQASELAKRFIGTWRLVSVVDAKGERDPLRGANPRGIIM